MDFSAAIVTVGPSEPTVWLGAAAIAVLLSLASVRLARWRHRLRKHGGSTRVAILEAIAVVAVFALPAMVLQALLTGFLFKVVYDVRGFVTVCTVLVPGEHVAPLALAAIAGAIERIRLLRRTPAAP